MTVYSDLSFTELLDLAREIAVELMDFEAKKAEILYASLLPQEGISGLKSCRIPNPTADKAALLLLYGDLADKAEDKLIAVRAEIGKRMLHMPINTIHKKFIIAYFCNSYTKADAAKIAGLSYKDADYFLKHDLKNLK